MTSTTLERPTKAKAKAQATPAPFGSKPARGSDGKIVEPAIYKMTKDAYEAATNYVDAVRGIINMMIVVYGGDIEKEKRPIDDKMFGLVSFMADCLNRAKDLTWQVNPEVGTACFNAVAIMDTLENVLSNFDLENPFGDETMDTLFRAVNIALNDLDAVLEEYSKDAYRPAP